MPATQVILPNHCRLPRSRHPGRTLVFVNAISAVRRVAAILKALGLPAHALHAQQQQRQRLKVRESGGTPGSGEAEVQGPSPEGLASGDGRKFNEAESLSQRHHLATTVYPNLNALYGVILCGAGG